jgi:regulator of protease activity HflC (stomatin/prohibitin superfamily)
MEYEPIMGYSDRETTTPSKGMKPSTIWTIIIGSLATLGLVIFFFTWLVFMHTEVVEPGTELVINDKPYFFGHDGIRKEPVTEGRVLLFNTSSAVAINVIPLSHSIKIDDFSSKDNILLDFETTIQYRVNNTVLLVSKFGAKDWFGNNVQNQYLAVVRDAVKKKTMSEMMSDVVSAADIDKEVTAGLAQLVKDSNLPITILNVSLGRAKPNQEVLAQMNETAAQQQRKKTLIEAEAAEIQRKREQTAKAEADNAYRNAMGLSPDMFIQLEAIKRFSETCKTSTCIVGAPGVPITLGKK